MKNIYIVTSKYMPLITIEDFERPSERAMKNHRIIHTEDVTPELLEKTFNESKNRRLAFNSKEDATIAMALGLEGNNTAEGFIDGQIPFFGVPVIFKAQTADDLAQLDEKTLTGSILYHYFEKSSIPLFSNALNSDFWKDNTIRMLDEKIKLVETCPKVFTVKKEDLLQRVQASYFAANPLREADVNLATVQEDLDKIRAEENEPVSGHTGDCTLF